MKRGPKVIGLTGSIGMGKSTVAGMFRDAGVPVFDADATVRALQGPGAFCCPRLRRNFPAPPGRKGLIAANWARRFWQARSAGPAGGDCPSGGRDCAQRVLAQHCDSQVVVFDIPLLFERTGRAGMDAVVVVSAPAPVQKARVLARPGMSEAKFADILAVQMPDSEKRALADFVIDTGTSLEETRISVQNLLREINRMDGNDA
jgi:dephospho-CoA kinase